MNQEKEEEEETEAPEGAEVFAGEESLPENEGGEQAPGTLE